MKTQFSSSLVIGAVLVLGVLVLRPTSDEAVSTGQPGSMSSASAAPPRGSDSNLEPRIVEATGLDPVTPPEEPSRGECAFWQATVDRMGFSIEQWATASSAVVRATVAGIGDAQWNTPDGNAPRETPVAYWDLMRLVSLEPVDTLRGRLPSTTVWLPGGTIGCLTFVVEGYDIEVGREYLLFMADVAPANGAEGIARARLILPIEDDGAVLTPIDGLLSITEISRRIGSS